jgi:hypothetical protein
MFNNKYRRIPPLDIENGTIDNSTTVAANCCFSYKKTYWTVIFGCIGICVFFIIYLPLSVNFVKYDQLALTKNIFGSVHSKPILTQGMYILNPMTSLVYFPSTYKVVKYITPVFSDTGLEFDMEIQFYYKIQNSNLYKIYDNFSLNYVSVIETNSKKTIKNVASTFTVGSFLQNRTYIEQKIAKELNKDLKNNIGISCPIEFFKITNIIFPPNIITNALNSAIALQKNEIAENQQNVNVYVIETKQKVSYLEALSKEIIGNSVSDSEKIKALSTYKLTKAINTARSKGLNKFMANLQINKTYYNKFINLFALMENTNLTLFANINTNLLIQS